ncbi:MAG TPA: Rrf2 family transcriptional regulator [Candidatus Aminicenantes bacterium]|nr:MAG: AsnC family transcriptional regulator [Candidatus Aminicenantes bacterium]HEK86154.1 Rrf2 family transcriptional regulator [Candidatus Aminicenantes bacterium]
MFRISTKGRYGTRLMLNLAQHYQKGLAARSLKEVAEEEDISIRYLEQIIIPLRVHHLVKSVRGAGGGYTLTRPPAAIKVSEVLQAVEGNCCLVECLEDKNYCPRMSYCAAYEIWKEGTRIMKEYFDSVSLQDMIKIAEKKSRRQPRTTRK